jgi:hypothetical protein
MVPSEFNINGHAVSTRLNEVPSGVAYIIGAKTRRDQIFSNSDELVTRFSIQLFSQFSGLVTGCLFSVRDSSACTKL